MKPVVKIPVLCSNLSVRFFTDPGECANPQPIMQFKDLAIDRVRYDQYKALCRQEQRKETKR